MLSLINYRPELIQSKLNMKFIVPDSDENRVKVNFDPDKGTLEVEMEPVDDDKEIQVKVCFKNVENNDEQDQPNVVLKAVELLSESEGIRIEGDIVGKCYLFLISIVIILFIDGYGITKPPSERERNLKPGVRIKVNRQFIFNFICQKREVGQYRIPLIAQFRADQQTAQLHHMALEVLVKVVQPDMAFLAPKAPYEPPSHKNFGNLKINAERAPLIEFVTPKSTENKVLLAQYPMSHEMQIYLNAGNLKINL